MRKHSCLVLTRHKVEQEAEWEQIHHWPFMFFSAVLFWNLVGASIFGFLINPPIALYYMQGLNTTANHGHEALFGFYGMLGGIGLTLYCMRGLTDVTRWNVKWIRISFWSLNIGLAMMTFLQLLPQGILQTYASIEHGYSYARSAEFIHGPIMQAMVWARVPGDEVFSVGVFALASFMFLAFVPAEGHAAFTQGQAFAQNAPDALKWVEHLKSEQQLSGDESHIANVSIRGDTRTAGKR